MDIGLPLIGKVIVADSLSEESSKESLWDLWDLLESWRQSLHRG